jgi:hypothetical protein
MMVTKQNAISQAVHMLMRGYEEEMNLYHIVHSLAQREKDILLSESRPAELGQVLVEKAEALDMIDRIESEMKDAKGIVMAHAPDDCPRRWQLAALLGSVQDMIEDVRDIERDNAYMLEPISA